MAATSFSRSDGFGSVAATAIGDSSSGIAVERSAETVEVSAVVGDARQKAVEALRSIGPLEGRQQRHHGLRPVHLIDDLEPIYALILLLQLGPADDRENIECDRLFDGEARAAIRSGDRAGGSGLRLDLVERLAEKPASLVTALRARVVETVVVVVIPEHGRRDRRKFEQTVPESFSQRVDGVGRVADLAHRNLLRTGSCRVRPGPRAGWCD